MEYWNVGFLSFIFLPIIPSFHFSNIPMLFRFHYSFFPCSVTSVVKFFHYSSPSAGFQNNPCFLALPVLFSFIILAFSLSISEELMKEIPKPRLSR